MSAILEVVSFVAPEGYTDNQELLKPALDAFQASTMPIKAWYGVQHEDKNKGFLAFLWGSQSSVASPASRQVYEEVISRGHTVLVQVDASSISEALDAPATEFAWAKLKSPSNREPLNDLTAGLVQKLGSSKGCFGGTFGPVLDATDGEGDTVAIVIGWENPETHAETVKGDPEVGKLFELSDLHLYHVYFKGLV